MKNNHKNNPYKRQSKDKVSVLKYIKNRVENGTGLALSELKKKYNEEQLFFVALKYITTTKKALCKSLDINIDNACRYKRRYEKAKILKQSKEDIVCPYSGYPARRISTNPEEFDDLDHSSQLSLF